MKGLFGTMTEILWIEPLPFVAVVRTLILRTQFATTHTNPLSLIHDGLLQTRPTRAKTLSWYGCYKSPRGAAPQLYSVRHKAGGLFDLPLESRGPNEALGPKLHQGATITPSRCLRLSCERNQP